MYHGSTRIAKALLDPETKQIEVWSTSIRQWLSSKEKLATQRYPENEKTFYINYHKKPAWKDAQTITFVHKE